MADNSLNYSADIAGKRINPPNPTTWNSESEANYKYAATFYQARKTAFLKYIDNKIEKESIEIITKDLNEIFEKVWSNGVLQALQMGVEGNAQGGQEALAAINKEYNLNLNYGRLLQTYMAKKANLGYDYEPVASSLLSQYFGSLATKSAAISDNVVNNLLTNFTQATGLGAHSKSAHIRGTSLIRMDIGNMELEQKNKISYIKGTNITSELQHFVDIDAARQKGEDYIPPELIPYLENGQFAGFSVKQMASLMNEKFSQSSVIANKINAGLKASTESGERRRWQTPWAEAYANWCISKSLFNIIGPIDIGLITGANFYWMDDFLNSARFRMRVMEDGGVDPNDPSFAYRKTYESTYSYISKTTGRLKTRSDDKGKIMITGNIS